MTIYSYSTVSKRKTGNKCHIHILQVKSCSSIQHQQLEAHGGGGDAGEAVAEGVREGVDVEGPREAHGRADHDVEAADAVRDAVEVDRGGVVAEDRGEVAFYFVLSKYKEMKNNLKKKMKNELKKIENCKVLKKSKNLTFFVSWKIKNEFLNITA